MNTQLCRKTLQHLHLVTKQYYPLVIKARSFGMTMTETRDDHVFKYNSLSAMSALSLNQLNESYAPQGRHNPPLEINTSLRQQWIENILSAHKSVHFAIAIGLNYQHLFKDARYTGDRKHMFAFVKVNNTDCSDQLSEELHELCKNIDVKISIMDHIPMDINQVIDLAISEFKAECQSHIY
eukprot:35261_1